MKKYLTYSTLAILILLFGCEEEHALRLHTAPEYYQGRAMLPTGQQIEMTETDRAIVLEACAPEDAVSKLPDGKRNWLGTVTLTQPLMAMPSTPAFPTATFFNVNGQAYVQCHVDTMTYVKNVKAVPKSILDSPNQTNYVSDDVTLHVAKTHERSQFAKNLRKHQANEHTPVEQTLVHMTLPFSGQLELTFSSSDHEETIVIPLDLPTRTPFLSIGLGTKQSEDEMNYGVYTSFDKKNYHPTLQPTDASMTRLLGAELVIDSPVTLHTDSRRPLFRFSFLRDGKIHQQYVSIAYKEPELLYGDKLNAQMRQHFTNHRHAVFHELALIGQSIDEATLNHATSEEMNFLFSAIERAKSTTVAGTPASMPYLTLFEGVRAQTFDISYDGDDVYVTNSTTGSHFKLLQEDAVRWHNLFGDTRLSE